MSASPYSTSRRVAEREQGTNTEAGEKDKTRISGCRRACVSILCVCVLVLVPQLNHDGGVPAKWWDITVRGN